MSQESKDNFDAIIDGETTIAGITLRPFTFGSMTLCRKLGLTIFTGDKDNELNDTDQLDQLCTFFWMQSNPVKEVLASVRDESWKEKVEDFSHQIPMHEMGKLMDEITRISNLAQEAAVDVIPKDSDAAEEGEPGN